MSVITEAPLAAVSSPAHASPNPPAAHASPGFALTPPAANRTMTVTKRSGRREPVDVNKIVRAVTRCCRRPARRRSDARGDCKTIAGLYDGATTRELDELSIRTAALLHRRRAGVLAPGRAPAGRRTSTRKCRARRSIRSRSRSRCGHEVGLINDRVLDVRAGQRAQAQRRDRRDAQRALRIFRPAHAVRPLSAAATRTRAHGDRDAAAVLHAHRLRAERRRRPRRSSCTGCSRRWNTSRARRRCSTPARGTNSCRAASCSTRPQDTLE